MDRQITPEIIVSSFDESDIHGYIKQLIEIQDSVGPEQPILVHIDSYGGSVYGFFMLYEHLISMGNPIITYTTSKAMSAGCFLLAMAGSPGLRFASPNSTILLHEVQGGAIGDMKDVEQQVGAMKVVNDRLLKLFAFAIGLKSAKEVRTMIKDRSVGHDLTLSADQARQIGIIDQVGYVRLRPETRFELQLVKKKG